MICSMIESPGMNMYTHQSCQKLKKSMRCVIIQFVCTPFDLFFSLLFENPFWTKGNEYSIYCFLYMSLFLVSFNPHILNLDIFSLPIPNSISRSLFFFSFSFLIVSLQPSHKRISIIFVHLLYCTRSFYSSHMSLFIH